MAVAQEYCRLDATQYRQDAQADCTPTAVAVSRAKPAPKPYKLRDGGGLCLLVPTIGKPRWCWDYRRPLTGQRNTLDLGTYPEIGLADARSKREDLRRQLAPGTDPGAASKDCKTAARELARETANTFGAAAEAWAKWKETQVSAVTAAKNRWLLDSYLLPDLRNRPIREVTPRELPAVLRKAEARASWRPRVEPRRRLAKHSDIQCWKGGWTLTPLPA